MKGKHVAWLAAGTLIALAALGAQAQGSAPADSAATSATSAPAAPGNPPMTAKETRVANRKLQRAVINALVRTKGVSVSNITVRANNGAVTLEGAVPEQSQIELATRAAATVPGVTSVKSALTLSTF
jgi:hyperosmotically inducible periplasmic protein